MLRMHMSNPKNLCNKVRDVDHPYEIWIDRKAGFEYRVLKKYQKPSLEAKNKCARWYMATKSPYTFGDWEYGDGYAAEVKEFSNLKFREEGI